MVEYICSFLRNPLTMFYFNLFYKSVIICTTKSVTLRDENISSRRNTEDSLYLKFVTFNCHDHFRLLMISQLLNNSNEVLLTSTNT